MKGTYLGEFEEIVLLAVGILREEAYGVSIRQEIEDQTAEEVRGGKRKRLFSLTPLGIKTLREAQAIRNQMWSQLPKIILQQR